MPSLEHAILVDLFRTRPTLVEVLLRHVGVDVPETVAVDVTESTFPIHVHDLHADLAVSFRGDDGAPLLVVLVEVQLSADRDKPYRWLLYQAAAQDRHRCDVVVLVVTPEAAVAEWAEKPIQLGPRGSYAPLVLGPTEIPRIDAPDVPYPSPELAVLSALARPDAASDPALLRRVAETLRAVHDELTARRYVDILVSKLGDAMQRAVEGHMISGEPLSDWFKKYFREGKAEGETKGLADALVRILAARSLVPTEEQRAIILACKDTSQLQRWIDASVNASSIADMLASR